MQRRKLDTQNGLLKSQRDLTSRVLPGLLSNCQLNKIKNILLAGPDRVAILGLFISC